MFSFFILVIWALFASEANAQVQLYQHNNFGGWSVNFPDGTFNRADLEARGGANDDATSIRVAPGFKATLYSDDNQRGSSIVKTADDSIFVDDNFNDVLTSLRVERIDVVELFQGCNYEGWRATFPIGIFNAAAIGNRGGRDNAASSLKIKPGFKVTLYDGDSLTGTSVVLRAGDISCLVGYNFNDLLSSMVVEDDTSGQCIPGDEVDSDNPPVPPTTIHDWISDHDQKGSIMTRGDYDRHVVVYTDNKVDRSVIGWVQPLMSRSVRYMKKVYDPQFTYGPDRLYNFIHQGQFQGGTISSYFDAFSSFRNAADVGADRWGVNDDNRIAEDRLTHELCHIVEGSSNGVHESPGFEVWKDSKWSEFFQFDLYKALGEEGDANRVFNRFIATRDNFPAPNTAWFRDWFFPLYQDGGGKCRGGQVMSRFFQLLKKYFPKRSENNSRNETYARRMNLGELVHFTSGAAGKDLSGRAQQAFGSGFNRGQFDQARRDFPNVVY